MLYDALPPQGDDFWKDADIKTHIAKRRSCEVHAFVQKGSTAECQCGVGFNLSPGMTVENGQIQYQGELVV